MSHSQHVSADTTGAEVRAVLAQLVRLDAQGDLETWTVQQARDVRTLAEWIGTTAGRRLSDLGRHQPSE
ncbi:hypothetical protein GCM10009759_39120 [Kitasatospora saccharophila]|uniref:Uncharacterized protein n=1 Tax=Kitasatospora saccharophila TaxID=407973 RepID=A0ABN2X596_9ACTN